MSMNRKSEAELLADFKSDFVQAWKRAETDDNMPEVTEKEVFEADYPTVSKKITPARLRVISAIRHHRGISVRALASELHRDYKNVHSDVAALKQAGIVQQPKGEGLYVPFKKIHVEIDTDSPVV